MVDIVEGMERDERAMEKIAFALDRLATLAEKWFEKQYPPKKVKRAGEIIKADDRAEQFSDKANEQWVAETEAAAGPSRFSKRFQETHSGEVPSPKKRSVTPVPQGDKDKPRTS